jgi:hypothetical protein
MGLFVLAALIFIAVVGTGAVTTIIAISGLTTRAAAHGPLNLRFAFFILFHDEKLLSYVPKARMD